MEPIRFVPPPTSPECRTIIVPPPPAEAVQRKSVLVVDDDRHVLSAFVRAFERAGFAVTPAAGATAALKTIRERRFDVIVSDLRMPRMDGLELRDAVVGDASLAAIPFIFVSGAPDDADRAAAASLGVPHFLEKTGDIDELTSLAAQLAG